MPPPARVVAALKRILEEIPGMDDALFQKVDNEAQTTVTHIDGQELVLKKSGVSRSIPNTMAYSFLLASHITDSTYIVWLKSPSTDAQLNREAVIIGLKYLIYESGSAEISRQVDMEAPPFV